MSLAKVIEVMAEGDTMERALENAVKQASQTVDDIKGIYVENIQGIVEKNKIVRYRINVKITFVVKNL